MTQPELTAEQQQAAASLERLRVSIAAFHASRLMTDEAMAGMRVVRDATTGQIRHPSTLVPIVQGMRDGEAERNAVTQLRDLLRLIYQREPTPTELRLAIPPTESLGIWWIPVVAVSAIIGGSFSLTSLFDYLTAKERTVQGQLGIHEPTTWASVVHDWAPTVVPAIAIIGVGIGGYVLWNKYGKTFVAKVTQKPEAIEELESVEDDEELE